jgi:hypothetical protein
MSKETDNMKIDSRMCSNCKLIKTKRKIVYECWFIDPTVLDGPCIERKTCAEYDPILQYSE